MKKARSVVIGMMLLLGVTSRAWALTDVTAECPGPMYQGVCQVPLGDLSGGGDRFVTVDLSAQCFPRVVNLRVSGNDRLDAGAPRGVYATHAGVAASAPDVHEEGVAEVSFYVRNASVRTAEHVWLGFIWQCEEVLP